MSSVVQALQRQCKEAQRLADVYREQVIQLEDQLARIREEGDVGKEMFKVFFYPCILILCGHT